MNQQEALSKMVAPRDKRRCWRNGILQIMITRACDLSCNHCSSGSNFGGKPMVMTLDQFELACDSLSTYWGVRATFGGNPAIHPKFEEICEITRAKIPFEQSGLWCNNPLGKGRFMRRTYRPDISNLNVHGSREAFEAFVREWPESTPYLKGLDPSWPEAQAITNPGERARKVGDSRHSPPYAAMCDLGYTEDEIWEKISSCPVNQDWSALIGVVRGKVVGYVCEIMAHQAMLHESNPNWRGTGKPMPDTGIDIAEAVKNGIAWWDQGMDAFAHQVREHCFACGIPLNGYGTLAVGGNNEQYTKTHEFIMKPKRRDRLVQLVTNSEELKEGGVERMTKYIENGSLPIIQ